MKNIAKVIKTVAAVICASALLPFGLLVAQAAPSDQYAVVRGVECVFGINGVSGEYQNLSNDEYTLVAKVPAGTHVFAYCQNGQGDVPLTSSPNDAGLDFFEAPTEVDPYYVSDRLPAAAPGDAVVEADAPQPASTQPASTQTVRTVKIAPSIPAGSNTVTVRQAPQQSTHQTSRTQYTQVVRNDGKVTATTTPSVDSAPAVAEEATDSANAETEEDMGTVSQDAEAEDSAAVDTNATSTTTSDNYVDGQQIEASDYASANLSLVDRMGGAGTLVGIVILGLIGAAGAISLARSIILG